ncbi:ATP-dependent DNA helicase [Trichonephila clavipes]|uniref:ATP-dependent DNA helicase n=1 Tax=Trichonephila clavipes TaxID=2585209 RepID=A0A8X6VHL5_TRICX|nr:ATP-dependent DNA helicase [Trichonephila clavipes]
MPVQRQGIQGKKRVVQQEIESGYEYESPSLKNSLPKNLLRALVFIAHGYAEHCLLYEPLAQVLASNNFFVLTHDHDRTPFQIFFTGPAGCGKTFVIKLLMEIYNRYTDNDGYCNAYMTCASTGKAAGAISETTVHTVLKISLLRLLPLHSETAQQYRTLFKYMKVIIIDEISMISAQLLLKFGSRLKQITGNFQSNFSGLDIILIGDFVRQLPPVRSTPIYKQPKQTLVGPILWQNLKFYELNEVMRQANQ